MDTDAINGNLNKNSNNNYNLYLIENTMLILVNLCS